MVFERLAQHFEGVLPKLWQFVQEEHTTMRKADLARTWEAPATNQSGMACGVVRRAEGPLAHKRLSRGDQPTDAVDFCHVQRLAERERRQDGGQRAGDQRLARSRWPAHQKIVCARRHHLKRAFDMFLSAYVREVEWVDDLIGGHQ